VQLRIESTKTTHDDPLGEFADEPTAGGKPAAPPASPHASRITGVWPERRIAEVPAPRHRGFALAVAAAVLQAPVVALWLLGVPSPFANATDPSPPPGTTSAAEPAPAASNSNGVAFETSHPGAGALLITTQPAGLPVSVDGVYRGRAPLTITDLPAGPHLVIAQFGDRPVERTVTVDAGASVPVLFTGPAAPAGTTRGRVLIDAPIPLAIYENGTLIGNSAGQALSLPPGDHLLEVADDTLGFRETRPVRVIADAVTPLAIEVPSAPVTIDAQPWAQVWVDGTPVGTTPMQALTWPIGRRQVRLRHPDLGERVVTVLVTLDGTARVNVDLREP
jgi:hypothetical protein